MVILCRDEIEVKSYGRTSCLFFNIPSLSGTINSHSCLESNDLVAVEPKVRLASCCDNCRFESVKAERNIKDMITQFGAKNTGRALQCLGPVVFYMSSAEE